MSQLNGTFFFTARQKAILLYNENKFPSIPVAHSVSLKENYERLKMLLIIIKYMEYTWKVTVDCKAVNWNARGIY